MTDFRRLLYGLSGLAIILLVNHFVFGQRAMGNIQIALTYLVTGSVFFACAVFQRRNGRVADGWHYLTPGIMDWLGVVLSTLMAAVILYIYYFVGSARADAAFQMQIARLLGIVFAAAGAACFAFSFLTHTRWNDRCIERRLPWGTIKTIYFSDIVEIYYQEWSQCVRVTGADGTRMYIPAYQNGAEALAETLIQRVIGGSAAPT